MSSNRWLIRKSSSTKIWMFGAVIIFAVVVIVITQWV